jgi:2-dehydropantoate 2-reductase
VAPALAKALGPKGRVLCLQNGVHNEDILSRHLGRDRVMPGVLYIGSERTGAGSVSCSSPPRVVFGTQTPAALDLKEPVLAMFEKAGIECTFDPEILASKWQKFVFNCGLNPLTTLTGRRLGFLLARAQGERLFLGLIDEAIAAGRASGAPLHPNVRERVIEVAHRMDISSSMAEDLAAGRAIENDSFSGHVVRLGRTHGVPTPVTQVFYDILAMADPAAGSSR